MAEFKDIILELRNEKHFNQEQLAKALNVSKSTVGMWEIGKRLPGPEKFEEIADYFNVDMDYLYGRTDIRKKFHYDRQGNEYVYNETSPMFVRESSSYFLTDETAQTAQEIFEKDRVLFDVYRSTDKDRLVAYAKKLKSLRDMEEGEE